MLDGGLAVVLGQLIGHVVQVIRVHRRVRELVRHAAGGGLTTFDWWTSSTVEVAASPTRRDPRGGTWLFSELQTAADYPE